MLGGGREWGRGAGWSGMRDALVVGMGEGAWVDGSCGGGEREGIRVGGRGGEG